MSKLRRIAEVGDGTYEQMAQKYMEQEEPVSAAKRRKKKFVAAQKAEPPASENNWEELKAALRVPQKSFDPESFSAYDVSRRGVRRAEGEEAEDDTPLDMNTLAGFHMFDDPQAALEEMLKESMTGQIAVEEGKMEKEIKNLQASQGWDEESLAWAQARLRGRGDEPITASDSKGRIYKTANETEANSEFGQTDYNKLMAHETAKQQRIENMYQRHRSIKDSRVDVTKEDRQAQWANDENIRSQSVQKKMNKSALLENLEKLVNE